MERLNSRKSSWVWNYFADLSPERARCSICYTVLSIKGGASFNLTRHLKSKHPELSKLPQERLTLNKIISKGDPLTHLLSSEIRTQPALPTIQNKTTIPQPVLNESTDLKETAHESDETRSSSLIVDSPIPSLASECIKCKRKLSRNERKHDLEDKVLLKCCMNFMKNANDESRIFGDFVACEIRNLPKELKTKVKRQITTILLDATDQGRDTTTGNNNYDSFNPKI